MNETLLNTIQTLQDRAEHLEAEASWLKRELARMAAAMVDPHTVVAAYLIAGEYYAITQAEVEAERARLARPHPDNILRELALIRKMAERHQDRPRAERSAHLQQIIAASRAAAIADGSALESEYEAAIDD